MKFYKNMPKIVVIEIEILYYLMNMNGLVSQVVIMLINEKMNSLKYNGRKLIFSKPIKICRG